MMTAKINSTSLAQYFVSEINLVKFLDLLFWCYTLFILSKTTLIEMVDNTKRTGQPRLFQSGCSGTSP